MIPIDDYPEDVSFSQLDLRFRIGGQFYDPLEWSLDGEIDAGFGPSMGWGSGIMASSGTLTFPPVNSNDGHPVSPWNEGVWPPSRGDVVVITAGYDGKVACIFTGIVASTTGGTHTNLRVSIRDNVDRLKRQVSFLPMMATSPRLDWTTDETFISQGLSSVFFLSRAAQWSGYHAVPDMVSGPGLLFYSALNGSLTPIRGWTERSSRHGATTYDRWPWWKSAPWGRGAYNLTASILPAPSDPKYLRIAADRPLSLSFIRGVRGTEGGSMTAHWGDMNIRLHADHHTNTAYLQLTSPSNTWRSATLPLPEDTVVVAVFYHGGGYELRNSLGDSISGSLSWNSRFSSTDMDRVTISIPENGTQLGATQVYMGVDWSPLDFERTLHLDETANVGTLSATKAIETSALSLIREICNAELSSAWLNNEGHLVIQNRNTMMQKDPVIIKTAVDDLLSYDWRVHENSLKRNISVQHKRAALKRSFRPTITVWQGPGDLLEAGEVHETFIGPSADEEWLAVQPDLWDEEAGDDWAGFPSSFNEGVYSWSIGSAGEDEHEHYRSTNTTIEQLGPRRWLIQSDPPSDVLQRLPTAPNNGPPVAEKWRGEPTPIVRAKGHIEFHDEKVSSSVQGPSWAEDYTHDAGHWVQNEINAKAIGDYIAQYTSKPHVEVRGVQIVPDPRLERGDVLILRDDQVNNRVVRGSITGIHHTGTPEAWEMTLDLQVISTTSTGDTYEDQRLAWLGGSYQEQADYWSTEQPVNSYEAQRRRSTWR